MQKDIKIFSICSGLTLALILVAITHYNYIFNIDALLSSFGIFKPLSWLNGTFSTYAIFWYSCLFISPFLCVLCFNFIHSPSEYLFKDFFAISFLNLSLAFFIYTLYTLFLYVYLDNKLFIMNNDYIIKMLGDASINSIPLYDIFLNPFTIKNQFHLYVFSLIPCILFSTFISLFMSIFVKVFKS